ncbi:MAG: hypothetical protein M3347_07650, partial [Armatimonadota bacterium]|nr:hypothetical protein [Armatimonadota bacterium]
MSNAGNMGGEIILAEATARWDGILELNLKQRPVHLCLASIIEPNSLPRFERIPLSDTLVEDFR